eukprot:Skav228274  [mRNA]  locus=scaffold6733:10124:14908:- [translate_table: standard]
MVPTVHRHRIAAVALSALRREVSVVMLGMADNAQYAGSTSGKLAGFSIAMANSSTTSTTKSEAPPTRTVVSACTELGGAVDQLVDSEDAVAAFTTVPWRAAAT